MLKLNNSEGGEEDAMTRDHLSFLKDYLVSLAIL